MLNWEAKEALTVSEWAGLNQWLDEQPYGTIKFIKLPDGREIPWVDDEVIHKFITEVWPTHEGNQNKTRSCSKGGKSVLHDNLERFSLPTASPKPPELPSNDNVG